MVNRINLFESLKDQYKIKFDTLNEKNPISQEIALKTLTNKTSLYDLTLLECYGLCFILLDESSFINMDQINKLFK
tara:strand:+ start:932 stop:1159 length:228 start_codon:yes stop_codon:yes gene_type:complete